MTMPAGTPVPHDSCTMTKLGMLFHQQRVPSASKLQAGSANTGDDADHVLA